MLPYGSSDDWTDMLRPCLLTLWGENFLGSTLVGSACNKFFHKETDGAVEPYETSLEMQTETFNYANGIFCDSKRNIWKSNAHLISQCVHNDLRWHQSQRIHFLHQHGGRDFVKLDILDEVTNYILQRCILIVVAIFFTPH